VCVWHFCSQYVILTVINMDAVCTCVSLTVFLYLMVQVPNNMCRFPLFTTVYRIVYENLPAKQITLNL
jgi:hypothetical protein